MLKLLNTFKKKIRIHFIPSLFVQLKLEGWVENLAILQCLYQLSSKLPPGQCVDVISAKSEGGCSLCGAGGGVGSLGGLLQGEVVGQNNMSGTFRGILLKTKKKNLISLEENVPFL